MQLFYTGSAQFEGESNARKSLGGYISSTEVPNDFLSNVFPEASQYAKQLNKPFYSVLALYNDDDVTATSVRAFFEYIDDSSDSTEEDISEAILAIGEDEALVDDCGHIKTKVIKQNSAPYGITFVEATEDEPLEIPDIPSGGYHIIFIRRTLDMSQRTDEELEAISNGTLAIDTQEDIILTINYDIL